MANNRVFYAIEQVAFKPNAVPATNQVAPVNSRNYATGVMSSGVDEVVQRWEVPRGVQSFGMTTTFNLEEVFELGQVEVYEQSERQPDIEFTFSKAIEGSKPMWFMAANPSGGNNLPSRGSYLVDAAIGIWPDTQYRATDVVSPLSTVVGSGMYISSVTYTFPVDGFVTEEITLVGNDKIWASFDASVVGQDEATLTYPPDLGGEFEAPVGIPSGVFGYAFDPTEPGAQESAGGTDAAGIKVVGSGIQRREEVDIRRSVFPSDIPGVITFSASGILASYVGGHGFAGKPGGTDNVLIGDCNVDDIVEHLQTVTCSADLGRADIFELGSKRPFHRNIDFPVEVTCSIDVITSNGDLVDARSLDNTDNTVANNTIVVRTLDGMQIDLGGSNRLQSIDSGGGDAGGDNLTLTYNYISYGTFNVTHDFFDPNHRIIVFETGSSRFNQGAPSFKRSDYGIW